MKNPMPNGTTAGPDPKKEPENQPLSASQLGMLLALAIALHTVENWIPPLPLPGARIGLANIVTLVVIIGSGWRDALVITVLRQIGGSLLNGTFLAPGFFVGLAGGIFGILAMQAAVLISSRFLRPVLSPIGVSCAGAVYHNLGQLAAAAIMLRDGSVINFLPFLLLLAIPSGVITGLIGIKLLVSLTGGHFFPVNKSNLLAAKGILPGDLAVNLLAVMAAVWIIVNSYLLPLTNPGHALISVNGVPAQAVNLKKDALVTLDLGEDQMVFEVNNFRIRVVESNCKDDLCIQAGWIERPGQSIVCLPNRVVVSIPGGNNNKDLDAVTY
ncbi:MAG: Gx transporter family protein [Bacillota bacterium]